MAKIPLWCSVDWVDNKNLRGKGKVDNSREGKGGACCRHEEIFECRTTVGSVHGWQCVSKKRKFQSWP